MLSSHVKPGITAESVLYREPAPPSLYRLRVMRRGISASAPSQSRAQLHRVKLQPL